MSCLLIKLFKLLIKLIRTRCWIDSMRAEKRRSFVHLTHVLCFLNFWVLRHWFPREKGLSSEASLYVRLFKKYFLFKWYEFKLFIGLYYVDSMKKTFVRSNQSIFFICLYLSEDKKKHATKPNPSAQDVTERTKMSGIFETLKKFDFTNGKWPIRK